VEVSEAVAAGIQSPYPGFVGDVAQALRPWPQYEEINWRNLPVGTSHYNALQVSLQKRFSAGYEFTIAYKWSRLTNDGASIAEGGGGPGVQNPIEVQQELTAPSYDDVPQILSVGWVYRLPFGTGGRFARNASGAVAKLISNWQFSAIQTYQSGRPLEITMDNNLSGFLFNTECPPRPGGRAGAGQRL
jgi:hypothetical protein